ncbi:hypothetical protein BN946_scf184811.g5 [Trametes cinnabarina]|uniref:Uncharacterized protein n=1 Tax=Pycnoporus cinnabarinus TaxID=5643 RepID=A0A060T0D1_PYCCI|nr:hypothetical protein BN946_scf184811.g5 [Trametes cinnabarina]
MDQLMDIDNANDDLPSLAAVLPLRQDPFSEAFLKDGMYVNTAGLPIAFSAGETLGRKAPFNAEAALSKAERTGSINFAEFASSAVEFEASMEPDQEVSEAITALEAMGFTDLGDEEDGNENIPIFDPHTQNNNPWWPYPNKAWFMIDLMDHQPRAPISDEQMKLFLWAMKECQTPGIPGFRALRTWQARRAQMMGFSPTHHTTALNNEYYANHPAELFRFNLANPLVRPHMSLYPEVAGPVSEFFHTNQMLAMDDASLDLGQLMWAEWSKAPHRHFYIKELARLQDDRFVIPLRWITVDSVESFDGISVTYSSADHMFSISTEGSLVRAPSSTLRDNCLDLKAQGYQFKFKGIGPNVWHRAYDCSLEQQVLFRIIPHILPADNPQQAEHCSHMTGKGSRPCRRCEVGGSVMECEQEDMYEQFFSGGAQRTVAGTIKDVREQLLVACLGVQDAVDQLQTKTGVKDKIAQYWIEKLIPQACDMQAIRMSHPETRDVRLRDLLLKGDERKIMKDTIKKEIQRELFQWLIEQPPSTYLEIPEGSASRGDIRPGDHYNPLLGVPGLDVHQDTPCEILHTYLLGVDKYVWHKTNTEWDKKNEQLFAVRLRASKID